VGHVISLLEVETAGLLTTVQDLGRLGQQRSGLTPSGAMDPFAASTANLLLGSPRRAAVLEITLLGPTLRFLADAHIALCGGDLSARLDDKPLPLWKTVRVQAGQKLLFGRRRSGARVYLAVTGGFAAPEVLGSRATFLRGGFGGWEGRLLRPGDTLPGFAAPASAWERSLRPQDIPAYDLPAVLRVLPGPHLSHFTNSGQAAFFGASYSGASYSGASYQVSPQSDRQGYRLHGAAVERTSLGDILSEPMPLGGIQIPPDGQPILLMADHQTTGGYPLIGVVILADIPRAAQLAPGDAVRFAAVTLAEAAAAAKAAERFLRGLELATGIG
jgi:antagonist of KipI